MDKRFWGAIAVIAVVFVGIVIVNNKNDASTANASATSHYQGQNKQDVTLVEYGDFQCPVCLAYYPIVKAVSVKYDTDIRFQFRHFPLQSAHKNAFAASRAAEAANKQGKFWEMYDKLYQNQDPDGKQGWVASDDPLNNFFVSFARDAGVANIDQFKTDFASEEARDIVNADLKAGNDLKVTGTPSFFLDGKQIKLEELTDETGRPSEEKFSKLIDKAIKDKGGTTSVDPTKPATTEDESLQGDVNPDSNLESTKPDGGQ